MTNRAAPIIVRPFSAGDELRLWEIYHSAVHQTASADYSPAQVEAWAPSTPVDLPRWTERIRGIAPFVALRDGQIVGYADVQPTGYIDHFFVAPEANRQGVGTRLMQAIHESAAAQNVSRLFSNVSLTARPLFEKWGFVIDTEQTVKARGVELTNFKMSKRMPGTANQMNPGRDAI